PVPGRNRDRRGEIAAGLGVARAAVGDVRVPLALAVADDVPVDDPDRVAGTRDDTLDEVDLRLPGRRAVAGGGVVVVPVATDVEVGARRRVEHHDVADLRVAEAMPDPVDEDALADLEGRHHRLARDAVRLDEEGLDAKREAQGHRDDHDQLEERAPGRPLLRLHAFSSAAGSPAAGASASAPPSASAGGSCAGAASASAASASGASAPASAAGASASVALSAAVTSGSAAVSAAPPASTTSVAVSPSASTASGAAAACASS